MEEKMLLTTGVGGGITAIGLLGILVQNYLVRKKDETGMLERIEKLSGKVEDLDKRHISDMKIFSDTMHEITLSLQQMRSDNQLQMQAQTQILKVTIKSLERLGERLDRIVG